MQTIQTMPKHIYDPRFQYVKAEHTDIRKTFQRVQADIQRTLDNSNAVDKMVNSWFTLEGR